MKKSPAAAFHIHCHAHRQLLGWQEGFPTGTHCIPPDHPHCHPKVLPWQCTTKCLHSTRVASGSLRAPCIQRGPQQIFLTSALLPWDQIPWGCAQWQLFASETGALIISRGFSVESNHGVPAGSAATA